jgi:hypothetical protein
LLTGAVGSGTQTFNIADRDSGFVKGLGSNRHLDYNTLAFYGGDTWRVKGKSLAQLRYALGIHRPVTERDGLGLMPRRIAHLRANDPKAVLDFAGKGTGREFWRKT